VRATASFAGGRYAEGVAFGRAVRDNPKAPTAHRALAINLALGGGLTEARDTLRTLKLPAPAMSQHWIRQNAVWSTAEQPKRYVEAFTAIGLK
jgi:hypothetical protein